ncbi:hypothetical protein HIM_07533 [Hirsutella minnesotensis 3608]|uniref:Uncharacterized protein n=1 Tax=Hirsutella minnesotensis 3608 TaxID=1043627 RepID=A0A0F8A487_9HYPO|nr:hypothetical protein HIM_07533 [Hirsutella minnesotensis 3608]
MLRLKCFVAFCAANLLRVAVAGEDLSDFSNNLASDLGPLLALFGEPMTRQYLSESTTLLDYFIFAVCPIGIITAIVSAIRVCGHSSLRAFIGRSQEGNGVVEAELCTSTSRDVCELFNHGGITRVLGQPDVLELVCVYPEKTTATGEACDASLPELHVFQDYLQQLSGHSPEWKKLCGSLMVSSDSDYLPFAVKPNLSLNAGIKRQPPWVFILVALTGFILQVGILVLAGFGAWKLDWELYKPADSSSKDYAPRMYIAGTSLLCVGMCSCAALVGQATREITFKRRPGSEQRTRLMWLQPGPQVIGDQSFGPFAHWETHSKQLSYWVSSRKRSTGQTFEMLTLLAATFTLMGYVLQFIGLRGLRAWVSIAQLGATLLMSFLRGLLRMQRLGKNDNELNKMPDLVAGHELDWIAFEIATQKSPTVERDTTHRLRRQAWSYFNPWYCNAQEQVGIEEQDRRRTSSKPSNFDFWNVTGTHFAAQSTKETATNSEDASPHEEERLTTTQSRKSFSQESAHAWKVDGPALFSIRRRLALLTGHIAPMDMEMTGVRSLPWKDDAVAVRRSAKSLASSLEQVAQYLFQKWDTRRGKPPEELALRVEAAGGVRGLRFREQEVKVSLRFMADSGWRVDSSSIEATLGLWMWSLLHDDRATYEDDDGNLCSLNVNWWDYQYAQIVSASLDEGSLDCVADAQDELSLWLGSDCPSISSYVLETDQEHTPSNDDFWSAIANNEKSSPDSKRRTMRRWVKGLAGPPPRKLRFVGWGAVDRSLLNEVHENESDIQLRIMTVAHKRGILHDQICKRELWSALVCSLWSLPGLAQGKTETTLTERDGDIRLENAVLTELSRIYVEHGLGTRSDALLSLVPVLRDQIQPEHRGMLDEFVKSLHGYRQVGEWERAQLLVRWACRQFKKSRGRGSQGIFECHGQKYASPLAYVLQQAGELYRWAFAVKDDKELRSFAVAGMKWMEQLRDDENIDWQNFAHENREIEKISADRVQEVDEIIDRYKRVAELAQQQTDPAESLSPSTEVHPLIQALKDINREEALFHLISAKLGAFGSKALQPAFSLAARNNWVEVLDAIRELRGSIDSQDEDGRTAISHCAERGYGWALDFLIKQGAFLDQADKQGRTPLHWAAKAGQVSSIQKLNSSGQVDCDRQDSQGTTALWDALNGNHLLAVKALLSAGANIESKRKDGQTPLTWAGQEGRLEIMKALFEHGADIGQKGDRERTALHWAAYKGHTSCFKLLIEKGGDVYEGDRHGCTPVTLVTEEGWEDCLDVLVHHGVDFASCNRRGLPPLHYAAARGHCAIVQKLINLGVEVDALDNSRQSALFEASTHGREKVVQLLIDNGANVNLIDQYKRTCLQQVVDKVGCRPSIIETLIKAGINVNHGPTHDSSALHTVAFKGYDDAAKAILDHGDCKLDLQDNIGMTALAEAAKRGRTTIARWLIDRGADMNLASRWKYTPLMHAAGNGHVDVVRVLIERGADIHARDEDGRTAVFHAHRGYNSDIVHMLVESGAEDIA